jgi:uncharacterized membrane protein
MRVLVTGAYGLIGSAVLARLDRDGHELVGTGRKTDTAGRQFPYASWWPLTSAYLQRELIGFCWLPIVVILIRLCDLARAAAQKIGTLPDEYRRLYAIWFALACTAFIAVILIFGLMIWKPSLW